jgi:protoporphyrinogen IX oxidase
MNLYLLALHIIFIVTWFAGLFYMPRLFIYHVEADKKPEPEKSILQNQYKKMQKGLWFGITWPSMVFTLIFGPWMVWNNPFYLTQTYFIIKLGFVFCLILYHFKCHAIYKQLQQNIITYSSIQLRIWNEVATVFLVAIVFLIVLKNETSFIWGVIGLVIFSAIIFGAIHLYKKAREKKS